MYLSLLDLLLEWWGEEIASEGGQARGNGEGRASIC